MVLFYSKKPRRPVMLSGEAGRHTFRSRHAIRSAQKDGRVKLPDAPGLGIKVNFAEFERKCPYKAIRSRAQLKL